MNYVPAIMINKSGQINQSTFGIRKKQQCVHAMIKEVFQFGQLYRKENIYLSAYPETHCIYTEHHR